MNVRSAAASRIVIALDPAGPSDLALEIAQHLPSTAATELTGLFVEDIRLFEHARSPLAREVVLSGSERPLELAALERQLRAQARQVRTRFEFAAAKLGLPHSFQIARGEIIAELAREAAHAEALVVSFAGSVTGQRSWGGTAMQQLARARLRTVLFAREAWRIGAGILAVVADPADALDELAIAARLSRHTSSPVAVLVTGGAVEDSEALAAELRAALRAQGADLRALLHADARDAASIARAARAQDARLLILPRGEPTADVDLVGELMKTVRTSLLLLAGR